ncbi:MAG: hypothetical protein BGO30_06855 [Bacteroidetes bacterium 41-46]|nr:MAG: hypothetical protein BGO30_06855 [Bacteroidetes bacterium 41-46]
MNKYFRYFLLFGLSLAVYSCAVERDESAEDMEKRVIESYIKVVHKDTLTPSGTGLYTITSVRGTGEEVKDSSYVYVTFSSRDLKGNYISTTDEVIAKRVGTYSVGSYYGPYLLQKDAYLLIRGVEEGLKGKRVGGEYSFIIPSWLSGYTDDNTNKSHSVPTIYDFKILRVVKDIKKFQRDTLEAYSNKYYGGIDSTKLDYYFKVTKATEGDTIKVSDMIEYYYVGKLLNGHVFDTNIEDTARKYGIYNSANSYEAATHTVSDPDGSNVDNPNNNVIKGVGITFLKMKYGETAVTFFSSEYGYGAQEQKFGVYQPLFFEIKVAEKTAN